MKSGFFSGLKFELTGAIFNSTSCTDSHPTYYGIQYVHKGPIYLSVNGGLVHLLEGPVVFFTSSDTVFSYGSPKDTSREQYYICASGERMNRYIEFGLFPLAVKQKKPYCRILYPSLFLTEMLNLIMLIRNGGKNDLAVCLYEHLLLTIQDQQILLKEKGLYQQKLEQLTQQILKEPEKDWDFKETAKNLNISEKHFLRIFGKAYGVSPHHFLLQHRISKACSLLLLTDEPIKSVADQCGFSNPYYFSRLFKKYMKTTPDYYRKTH
jgi:transcriptional regulator, araC family